MIQYIQSINLAIHIVPIHKSYRVEGVYKPVEKYIKGYLFVKLYDHRLKYKQMIHCQWIYAIPENRELAAQYLLLYELSYQNGEYEHIDDPIQTSIYKLTTLIDQKKAEKIIGEFYAWPFKGLSLI